MDANIPPKKKVRERFTPEEDYVIRSMYQGVRTNWGTIAKILNRDSEKMIYDRYHAYLAPGIISCPLNSEELDLLKKLVEITGTNWKFIRRFFPGRTIYTLKNNFQVMCNHGKLNYRECVNKPHIEDDKIVNQRLLEMKRAEENEKETHAKKTQFKRHVIQSEP